MRLAEPRLTARSNRARLVRTPPGTPSRPAAGAQNDGAAYIADAQIAGLTRPARHEPLASCAGGRIRSGVFVAEVGRGAGSRAAIRPGAIRRRTRAHRSQVAADSRWRHAGRDSLRNPGSSSARSVVRSHTPGRGVRSGPRGGRIREAGNGSGGRDLREAGSRGCAHPVAVVQRPKDRQQPHPRVRVPGHHRHRLRFSGRGRRVAGTDRSAKRLLACGPWAVSGSSAWPAGGGVHREREIRARRSSSPSASWSGQPPPSSWTSTQERNAGRRRCPLRSPMARCTSSRLVVDKRVR